MGVYFKMSVSYLRRNKFRTLLLILGVVLGVVLIFGINVIKDSNNKNTVQASNKLYGGYHTEFRDLSFGDSEKLKKDKNVSKITTIQNLGSLIDKKGGLYELKSVNKEYMDRTNSKFIKGRFPRNNDEIVFDKRALEVMGIQPKLNLHISLKVKKEYQNQDNESVIYTKDKTFRLVGITEKPEAFYDAIYELEAFTYGNNDKNNIIPKESLTYSSLLTLKSGWKNIENETENLMMKYNLGKKNYLSNAPLVINLSNVEQSIQNQNSYKSEALITITSIIFVFNIFNITLNETIKEMGLIRLVGGSKKNIRSIIIYQSLLIMIVGIIVGLIVGILYSYVGINMYNAELYKEAMMKPKLYITGDHIKKAILPGILSILVSSIIPILKIGKISPMSAIKKTDKSKVSNRSYKIDEFLNKIFGFYGFMAIKNIERNKTRALISVLSIALGGYVFITTFAGVKETQGQEIEDIQNRYDVTMQFIKGLSDVNNLKYTDSDVANIKKIDGIKNINAIQQVDGIFKFKKNDISKQFIKYYGIKGSENMEYKTNLILYEDQYINSTLKSFVRKGDIKELGEEIDGYKNVALYNYFYDIVNDHTIKPVFKDIKVGDILTIKVPITENNQTVYKDSKVRICAILNSDWISRGDGSFGNNVEIVTSFKNSKSIVGDKKINKIGINLYNPYDKVENKEIEKISKNIPSSNFSSRLIYSETGQEGHNEYIRGEISTIVLVLIIAAINIYCTIRTNIVMRNKEIAIFRAIGMSIKNIKKMVLYEALTYSVLSFIIALTPSIINLIKFVNLNNDQYKRFGIEHFMDFKLPIMQFVIYLIISLAVCLLAVAISVKEFKCTSIIDGIKESE